MGQASGILNPDSYLRREMKLASDNAQKNKVKCPSILIRAHIHFWRGILTSFMNGYSIPCWEFTTDFMEKKSANSTPDIGGLVMDEIGDLFLIYPELYPIPEDVLEAMHSTITIERKERKRGDRIKHLADLQGLLTKI